MTRRRRIVAAKMAVVLGALIPALIQGFSGGPLPGLTGAPGENTCTQCHTGSPLITNSAEIKLLLPGGAVYRPGEVQRWTVQVTRPGAAFYGFELSVRAPGNGQAGVLSSFDATTRVLNSGGIQYVEHTAPAVDGMFSFDWTAPAADIGTITVYVAANAANGNGNNTGDQILNQNFTLTPAAVGGTKPAFSEGNPVVNGASFAPGIAAGGWVSLFGTDLAPFTRPWNPATEIINGVLPTELDGVSVTINGRPAAIAFLSPTQLNVQAPDDDSEGPVQVIVTRDGVASDPAMAQLQRNAPGFFVFDQGGRKYVAAVHADLGEDHVEYVGPDGLFGDAERSRPAKAGDIIMLFGTGFGPTDPAVPSGEVFTGAAPLTDPVTIRFGDVAATVEFAGLSGAGLHQFNVRVPPGLPEGDVPIVAEVGGLQSQVGVFIFLDE